MASDKVQSILDEIKGLTLIEAAELAKAMEDEFGVSAAAPVAAAAPGAAPAGEAGAPAAEEQTEFDVILKSVDAAKKIGVIKVVRELTSLGLKEAKDLVENAPKPIKEGVEKEEADAAKAKLTEAGAEVDIQ